MSTAHKSQLTAAEYLAIERSASIKSEFYHGDMFAMADGRPEHSIEFNHLKTVISLKEIYRGVSFKSVNPTAAQSPSSNS